jgi:ribulose kinase
MEIPKILWLKKNMPSRCFEKCHFYDLPDYLTYRATGSGKRSACSLVCKCSYIPESGWQADFFSKIGLGDLVDSHYRQLSTGEILNAGLPVGSGLSGAAAAELGLLEGTPVGSAVIDA